ncbi:MAG: hypothetical protein CSYNP_00154 [Syntrophus sp. SKADARSKE-3]|nr:hypothetical protein [Syntrophus sp. SKADARSKE-3]
MKTLLKTVQTVKCILWRAGTSCRLIAACLLSLVMISAAVAPVFASDATVPSYGKGPRELIVFTDYWCPPCMMIEANLEPAIMKVLAQGDIKITFVDMPFHTLTPLYAKYFLFATRGAGGYKNAMHARKVLFGLSKQNLAKTESDIENAFKAQGVAFKHFDVKPVFAEWEKIFNQYKIKSTPTCILINSATSIRTYKGTVEIRNNLIPELEARTAR